MPDNDGDNLEMFWKRRSRDMGKNYVSVLRSVAASAGARTRKANLERRMRRERAQKNRLRRSVGPVTRVDYGEESRPQSRLGRIAERVRSFFRRNR